MPPFHYRTIRDRILAEDRLQDRATKRRQIAKDVMVELDLKKLSAPDFIASIRPGIPALMVIDEAAGKSQGLFGKKRTLRRGP
ncbi:MAG TPA: hypothetical protein VGJ76_10755 [Pseudolabrys sp.]